MGLAERLRGRRPLLVALLGACALSVLCMLTAMHSLDHALDALGGLAAVPGFASMHARFGVPWWLQAWGVGLAYLLAVAALWYSFEALGRWMDPADASAGSLGWSLRGWLLALLALLVLVLAGAAIGALMSMAEQAGSDLGQALTLAPLAMYFFVWNPDFVGAARPLLRRLRPRWPGAVAVLLPVALMLASLGAEGAQDTSIHGPLLVALVLTVVLLGYVAEVAWRWLWLNRCRNLLAATAIAIRPRVLLPNVLLDLRALLALCAPILAVLPVAWLLMRAVPVLEHPLALAPEGDRLLLVECSRFAVHWWWAILLVYIGVVLGMWSGWFRPVASGRLLYQLGLVREDAVQAGEPSGLRSAK